MKTLEIVHLRSSGKPIESLGEMIGESIRSGDEAAESITVYRRHGLGTDIAIHIRRFETGRMNGPSALAYQLANSLRAYGLVEHTMREEMP